MALLLVSAASASPQDQNYIGTYEVCRVVKGRLVDNKTIPPGEVMIAEMMKGGAFAVRDFLSGFDGKWSVSGRKLVLTIDNGPAGKLKKPQVIIFKPTPDRTRLVIVAPKYEAGTMELHWDPKALEKRNAKISAAMKRAPDLLRKKSGG